MKPVQNIPGLWTYLVLATHAPGGDFARAFSPSYHVHFYRPDGNLRHELQRDVAGPLITAAEKRAAEEELRDWPGRVHPYTMDLEDYPIPDRKPVIRHMWYDEDGLLWVHLWPSEAEDLYRADVYNPDGTLSFEAVWPKGVAIWRGGGSGDVALGVREIALDVHQVVRVRFRPVPNEEIPGDAIGVDAEG